MISEHFIALPPVGQESKPLRVRGAKLAFRWSWWGSPAAISVGGGPPASGLLLHLRRRGVEVVRQFVGFDGRIEVGDGLGFDEVTIENLTNTAPSLGLYFRCVVGGPGDVPELPPELVSGLLGPAGARVLGYIQQGEADAADIAPVKVGGVDNDGTIWPLPLASAGQSYDGSKLVPVRLADAEQLYDSGSVTGGAAIDSGVLDVRRFSQVYVVVNGAGGTVTRTLEHRAVRDDASQVVDWSTTVPYAVAPMAFSKSASGTAWGMTKARRWYVPAGGTGTCHLTIWGMP